MIPKTVYTYLKPVFNDRESGSGEILAQLKEAIMDISEDPEVTFDVVLIKDIVREALDQLGHFAVVVDFLDQLLNETPVDISTSALTRFFEAYDSQWNKLPTQHVKWLRSVQSVYGQTILLHSHSSSIVNLFNLLTHQVEVGKTRIFQSISHPKREGLIQGQRLLEQGWKVLLIEDAMMGRMVTQCDFVLLGSDVITVSTFVNKIGSMPLVAAARMLKIPVYILGDERKLVNEQVLPESLVSKLLNEAPKPDRELDLKAGQTGLNYYFEHVPIQWVNGFLLNGGIYSPNELNKLIRGQSYSDELLIMAVEMG